MKKSILFILSALIIIPTVITGCGENKTESSQSQEESAKAKEEVNYTLDEDFTYGDLTVKIDSNWKERKDFDTSYAIKIDEGFGLSFFKKERDDTIKSEEDALNSLINDNSAQTVTDKSHKEVDGHKVLLFSYFPMQESNDIVEKIYNRDFIIIVNDNIYVVSTNGTMKYKDVCDNILSDVLSTLIITPANKITEEPTTKELTAPPTGSHPAEGKIKI